VAIFLRYNVVLGLIRSSIFFSRVYAYTHASHGKWLKINKMMIRIFYIGDEYTRARTVKYYILVPTLVLLYYFPLSFSLSFFILSIFNVFFCIDKLMSITHAHISLYSLSIHVFSDMCARTTLKWQKNE
jgi:hypothetical protein